MQIRTVLSLPLYALIAALPLSAVPFSALAEGMERVEIPVAKVMLPAKGFDDNDSVEAVVTGDLPNPCYSVAETVVDRSAGDAGEIRIRQYAWRRASGNCATPDLLDEPVPFTAEARIGLVNAGDHRITYGAPGTGLSKTRTFSVERAPVQSIDSFSYAVITNVDVEALISPTAEVSVVLSGMLTSTCAELVQPVDVRKLDDVIVVLPVIREQATGEPCAPQRRGVRQTLKLGKFAPGEYLLHVRSRNGQAVNRVFTVVALAP